LDNTSSALVADCASGVPDPACAKPESLDKVGYEEIHEELPSLCAEEANARFAGCILGRYASVAHNQVDYEKAE